MQTHPDAAALDRLGYAKVHAHNNISRQLFAYWRKKGVPQLHRRTLVMLGAMHGVAMPEMEVERAS